MIRICKLLDKFDASPEDIRQQLRAPDRSASSPPGLDLDRKMIRIRKLLEKCNPHLKIFGYSCACLTAQLPGLMIWIWI
jgi:hypothetical protein